MDALGATVGMAHYILEGQIVRKAMLFTMIRLWMQMRAVERQEDGHSLKLLQRIKSSQPTAHYYGLTILKFNFWILAPRDFYASI